MGRIDTFVPSGPQLSGTFVPPPEKCRLKKLFVYIDEFGDRNFKDNRQSDYFGMTAVIVPEEADRDLRFLYGGLRAIAQVADGQTLHWCKHFPKDRPERRLFAVDKMAAASDVRLVHVALHKPSILEDAGMRRDHALAYNYVTRLLVERIATVAASWGPSERTAVLRFGIVGGVDHRRTMQYLHHVATHPEAGSKPVPWANLIWPFKWLPMSRFHGLQVADAYSSLLKIALVDGDGSGAMAVRGLFHHDKWGRVVGSGFALWPHAGFATVRRLDWWPALHEYRKT